MELRKAACVEEKTQANHSTIISMLSRVVLSSARSSLKLARPLANYGALQTKKYSTDKPHPPRTPITDHPIVTNDKAPKEKNTEAPSQQQGADFPNSTEHRPSHAPPPHDAPSTSPKQSAPQQAAPQPPTPPQPAPQQATTQQAPPQQQAPQATQQAAPQQASQAPTNGTPSGTPEITGPPTPSMPFFILCLRTVLTFEQYMKTW